MAKEKVANPNYIEYLRPYARDSKTVRGKLFYGTYYGRIHPKFRHILLVELNKPARILLDGLLEILTEKSKEESIKLIGFAGYRYIVGYESQTQLGKLIGGLSQQQVSEGLAQLEKYTIIKQLQGVQDCLIIVNPFVYCTHSEYDVRVLEEFGIYFETNAENTNTKDKNPNSSITRKKQDMSKVHTEMEF